MTSLEALAQEWEIRAPFEAELRQENATRKVLVTAVLTRTAVFETIPPTGYRDRHLAALSRFWVDPQVLDLMPHQETSYTVGRWRGKRRQLENRGQEITPWREWTKR